MTHYSALILALCLAALPGSVHSQQCIVASVHDGDSLRLRCPEQKGTLPVRLAQIDAPELNQAHGLASRDFLRSACPVGSSARLLAQGKDQYRRTLGDVDCGRGSVQVLMIQHGQAWVYDQYATDKALFTLQDQAKAKRIGLWERREVKPPWDFRRETKAAQ